MKNNNVTLRGNVGADAILKDLPENKKLLSFNLATSESFKDQAGEWKKNTTWHRIVIWGAQAEKFAPIVTKGTEVIVEGKINSRSYTDKEGQEKTMTEIVASDIIKTVRKTETA